VNSLQEQFVIEARDLVRRATDDLIALERDGASSERIDRVFRAFHTLKGSAGVVELPAMSLMLHAAEDLLAALEQNAIGISADVVDAALAALDQTSRWVDAYEAEGTLPAHSVDDGRALADRLRSLLTPGAPPQPGRVDQAPPPQRASAVPDWAASLVSVESDALAQRMPADASAVLAICYEPTAGCFFTGDDPLQLMRRIPRLLALRITPRAPLAPLSDLDPYSCNLRLEAIAADGRAAVAEIFRLVPDQVRIVEIAVGALPRAATPVVAEPDALLRAIIEAQCDMLRAADRQDDLAGCIGAAGRVAANALRSVARPQLAGAVQRAAGAALAQRDGAVLVAALERVLGGFDEQPSATGASDPEIQKPGTADAPKQQADRVLRVSEAKIEALMNLSAEFVVARNALTHTARRAGETLGQHEAAALIRRDHDAIDRLVTELHGTILQLRMVPVAQVFQSFPRLVRDVARQLDKSVALQTRGEATEADKTIVDRLFEPLVHLVRNALDHGIESREQRRALGKPEIATITIEASRAGDRFLVTVSDDGRGIDPAAVRRKAADKRLMSAEDLAALTDEQAIDLVFAAGFSTAAEISDISGRGVGMDVVRSTVEGLGGRVTLTSRPGAGTTVRLDLPMTIAMSRIMVVEAGRQLFGVSMEAVSETTRVAPERISRIKNNLGFVQRDRVVPIVSLAELMKLPEPERDLAQSRLFLVVEAAGRIAAVEVDAVRDRLDVVLRPMQGLLAGARGYAGTTLLGNGQVLLVLDMKELLT
jgi:two-component system chemotaxis sensor kinase CheA